MCSLSSIDLNVNVIDTRVTYLRKSVLDMTDGDAYPSFFFLAHK